MVFGPLPHLKGDGNWSPIWTEPLDFEFSYSEAGYFTNVYVSGDIVGATWDGAIPADLSTTSDPNATQSFYGDSSAGAWQFMGDLWVGGSVTLVGTGAFQTAASGSRVIIQGDDAAYVRWESGGANEVTGGSINNVYQAGGSGFNNTQITSGHTITPSSTTKQYESLIVLRSLSNDETIEPTIDYYADSHVFYDSTSKGVFDAIASMDSDGLKLNAADGYLFYPSSSDLDTWIGQSVGDDDEIRFTAGGVLLMHLIEGTDDYALFPEFLALGDTGASGLTGFQASGQDDQIEVRVDGTERVRVGKTLMTVGQGSTVDLEVEGTLRTGMGATLTIASGSITPTHSYHRVNTESAASSDDLDTITAGSEGDILVLRIGTAGDSVVCKDGTGNLALNGDFTMNALVDSITLMYFAEGIGLWTELSRSNNA